VQEALEAVTADLVGSAIARGRGAAAESSPTEASTERGFAEVLADVVRVDGVSVDSNFFDDLGADSLVMAQFFRG